MKFVIMFALFACAAAHHTSTDMPLEDMFIKMDTYKDNALSKPEVSNNFLSHDSNNDSVVTLEEFISEAPKAPTCKPEMATLLGRFKYLDKTLDGIVDRLIHNSSVDVFFQRLDTNHDSVVTLEEFISEAPTCKEEITITLGRFNYLDKLDGKVDHLIHNSAVDVLFQRLDTNRNDCVSKREFLANFPVIRYEGRTSITAVCKAVGNQKTSTGMPLKDMFHKMDTNKDNGLSKPDVSKYFLSHDSNNDSVVTLEEFISEAPTCKRQMTVTLGRYKYLDKLDGMVDHLIHNSTANFLIQRLDTNHDSVLTFDEFISETPTCKREITITLGRFNYLDKLDGIADHLIHNSTADVLFQILDTSPDGCVSIQEFIANFPVIISELWTCITAVCTAAGNQSTWNCTDMVLEDMFVKMDTYKDNALTKPEASNNFLSHDNNTLISIRLYFQSGPSAAADYQVGDMNVTELVAPAQVTDDDLNRVIDQHRKSNINIHATLAAGINAADIQIHVLQTKKSFPFGSAVSARAYNRNDAGGKYRDFIHKHFNWAVPENSLKWNNMECTRGHANYTPALDMIRGLKSHGIMVRGHTLVWSSSGVIQDWVKALSGTELRNVVTHHIQETMNVTRGLLEHWDVNNENLHGQWYQNRLNDLSYNLELFRIAHAADPNVRLFLNEYRVVARSTFTNAYLAQAQQFKAAGPSVALSGMGVQCHFGNEYEPNATVIKQRLDVLAQAGVPIWATELDVQAQDENRRADFYEKALRALYAHPAVEGILFWGFWDKAHWKGERAALVKGKNFELTAAGRRVLDLLENQWMTDETLALPSNHQLSVRGFHGDYVVHVIYQGRELTSPNHTFTLGKGAHAFNINIQLYCKGSGY